MGRNRVSLTLERRKMVPNFNNLLNFAPSSGNLSFTDIAARVINFLLLLAGIIALIYIIYIGILYITSANRPEQAQKAQQALINVIIGIVVITLSYILIRLVTQSIIQVVG